MTVDLSRLATTVPDEVVARLRGARMVLSVGHADPDGDSLGASIAVAILAEQLGARCDVLCDGPPPAAYSFLPRIDRVLGGPDDAVAYDLLVVSDCGALERIGAVQRRHAELFARLPRVVIDHHASNGDRDIGAWVDPTAAATCEMVALLASRLGVPLTAADGALASALMTGVVMDTATFAHPNATPRTLMVAAALVEAGAPLSDISRRLYRTKPDAQLRLFGRVLARAETTDDGLVVHSTVSDADVAAAGARPEHTEGIIDLLAQSDTAEVAALFKQVGDDGRIRLSVRTRPGGVDATLLTGAFGGGGHARAAGATLDGPLESARDRVLGEAARLVATVARS
jgi:phosphoesterase RecJ-like protein